MPDLESTLRSMRFWSVNEMLCFTRVYEPECYQRAQQAVRFVGVNLMHELSPIGESVRQGAFNHLLLAYIIRFFCMVFPQQDKVGESFSSMSCVQYFSNAATQSPECL
jgi:hypothetical protein